MGCYIPDEALSHDAMHENIFWLFLPVLSNRSCYMKLNMNVLSLPYLRSKLICCPRPLTVLAA